jgi:subfamily B ATP-binding cassette protein MsbA
LAKSTNLRNIKSDENRIEILKSYNFLTALKSKEFALIVELLKPKTIFIIVLGILLVTVAFIEGIKMLVIIAFVKSLFISQSELLELMTFSIMGEKLNLYKMLQLNQENATLRLLYVFLLLSVFTIITTYISSVFIRYLQLNLMYITRTKMYDKLMSLNLSFFSEAKTGEIMFMLQAETSRFSNLLLYLQNAFLSFFNVFVISILMFSLSTKATLLVCSIVLIYFLLHMKLDKRVKIASWNSNKHQNKLLHQFQQIVYGIKLIKLANAEKRERKEFSDTHQGFESEDINVVKLKSISNGLRELLLIFVLLIVVNIFIGGIGNNPEDFMVFLLVLLRGMPFFNQLQSSLLNIVESFAPLFRVASFLRVPDDDIDSKNNKVMQKINTINQIEFKNISYKYPKSSKYVLKNLNLKFEKGKRYAIIGLSGSGKTTLLDILTCLIQEENGEVFYNKQKKEIFNKGSIRKAIGYVGQEPLVFHDTLINNIKFFKSSATLDEVNNACKIAEISKFITSLEKGFETGLGERGLSISGGERQRIGLARVILKNTPVLLLDESTNALDLKTEKSVYNNIKQIAQEKIVIAVAHRLSAITDFDEIIVLQDGMVVEIGTHSKLIEKKGYYHSIYTIQGSL